MEITQEHDSKIQEIMKGMKCPNDFKCYKSGFEDIGKIMIICDGKLVRCLEEKEQPCQLGFAFGYGYFCVCPLRKYIAQNFNK
jgi:hypothetical protein